MITALNGFGLYHGVDISSVVIATATERFAGQEHMAFTCADITRFEPDRRLDNRPAADYNPHLISTCVQ